MKTRERVVKFFPRQFDAFNFSTQFGAAVAGVQSGKTFLGAHWSGKKCLEFPDKNGIIVAPTYNILRAATLKKFFDVFPELRQYYKEHKGEINLPTGGTVYIRSADNPLGIEGITAHWAWLDEGGMCSVLTWTVLRSRVSMTGGQILVTTTPYNMGWLYTDFYLKWKNKEDESLSFFTWASIDSPYYSKEFYEAEKRRLSPQEFAKRYRGEFQKMTGLVWDLPQDLIIAPIDGLAPKSQERFLGVDWGYTNPSALCIIYLYDQKWYVVDEWKGEQKLTSEIIQMMKNKITEHKITRIFADPAEPDRIEEVKRANIGAIYGANKDIEGGVGNVRNLIFQRKLFVYNNCHLFLDEINSYHYPEQKMPKPGSEIRENKELPEKFNDHLMDAMRYVVHSYQLITPQATKPSLPVLPYYPEIGF